MSSGVIPPTFVCHDCHRSVFGADATTYEGMHFHDHCLPGYLAKQEAGYEKKTRLGKITLAESVEYTDIRQVGKKVRQEPTHPNLEKTFFPDIPKFSGHTRLSEESVRRKMLKSTEEWKRLGISRKEYIKLCIEREEKLREKYQIDQNNIKRLVDPIVAGEIFTCSVCGKRTFCIEGKCYDCSCKTEQKYIDVSEGKNTI